MASLLGSSGFWVACAVGALAVGVTALLRMLGSGIGAAPALGVAVLAGFAAADVGSRSFAVGLLLAGMAAAGAAGRGPVIRTAALVPAAAGLAAALGDGAAPWTRAALVGFVVGGLLVAVAAERWPRLWAVLIAMTALAVYDCVPDTEWAVATAGALFVVGLFVAVWPRPAAAVAVVATTALGWAALRGGAVSAPTVVGSVAAFGALVLLGLLVGAGAVAQRWAGRPGALRIVVVHAGLGLLAARVVSRQDSTAAAVAIAAGAGVVGAGALAVGLRRRA